MITEEPVVAHQGSLERVEEPVLGDTVDARDLYQNRELSWLAFASRVLALVEEPDVPLMERIRFAGIMGMLHDEFYMKRVSALQVEIDTMPTKLSMDGQMPAEELAACRVAMAEQVARLGAAFSGELRQRLADAQVPIRDHEDLTAEQKSAVRHYFRTSVLPILTPLAVDAEHPFPFISNLVLNLAVVLPDDQDGRERFVRLKVPNNRPRWVALPEEGGHVPLEQVIAANLDLLFPATPPLAAYFFRVTRAVEGTLDQGVQLPLAPEIEPGVIVQVVSSKLKARRFARAVRLQVDQAMPESMVHWLVEQLDIMSEDVVRTSYFLGLSDLHDFRNCSDGLCFPHHEPQTHPRLRALPRGRPGAIFEEIARGDILLHHPYDSFETSVLRFLEAAAVDPEVLAMKVTIYRTSSDSPILRALAEAARRGKQVAVLVEITARFDEAPNIAWGEWLEKEGVHVAYGVDRLKTHVKLALVVREEGGRLRRYAHIGTGNYHTGTARAYEDLGLLTGDQVVCDDVASVFNALTGASAGYDYRKLLVAPITMRPRFLALIEREIGHAEAGRPCGIYAKLNQLQDPEMIQMLYRASGAGVATTLNVRGVCCLLPGVPGLSENVRVYSVVWRFLEHSRIYRFENGGQPEHFIGSADWMTRNLNKRVETVAPIQDRAVQRQLDRIIALYEADNCTAWDAGPDGSYLRRRPGEGEPRRSVQDALMRLANTAPGD